MRVIADLIIQAYRKYPGFLILIGGPAARNATEKAKPFLVNVHGKLLMRESDSPCVMAAFVHCFNRPRGWNVAIKERDMFRLRFPTAGKIYSVASISQGQGLLCNIKKRRRVIVRPSALIIGRGFRTNPESCSLFRALPVI